MSKKFSTIIVSLLILGFAACVTINIYFPAAEVQKAADKIVSDVRSTGIDTRQDEGTQQEQKDKESLLIINQLTAIFLQRPAFADMDIELTTPAIRSIKESLKNRFSQLKPFYDDARIGENNQGALEIRNLEGLGLKEKSLLIKLVEEENKDRTNLYKEILIANNLGIEHLKEVQNIFANSWRNDAPKGWWIQTDEGVWKHKE